MLVVEKIIILSAMLVLFGIFLMYFIPALDEVNESKKEAEDTEKDNEDKILIKNQCNTLLTINKRCAINPGIPISEPIFYIPIKIRLFVDIL